MKWGIRCEAGCVGRSIFSHIKIGSLHIRRWEEANNFPGA